jgi:hypothetical protein
MNIASLLWGDRRVFKVKVKLDTWIEKSDRNVIIDFLSTNMISCNYRRGVKLIIDCSRFEKANCPLLFYVIVLLLAAFACLLQQAQARSVRT